MDEIIKNENMRGLSKATMTKCSQITTKTVPIYISMHLKYVSLRDKM